MMLALYHWHPYELQAFVWGVVVGLLVPVNRRLARRLRPPRSARPQDGGS